MKLIKYTAETPENTLEFAVFPETDLDSFFLARCLYTGEVIRVQGYNLTDIYPIGETEELRIEVFNVITKESYIISDWQSAKTPEHKLMAKKVFLSKQSRKLNSVMYSIFEPKKTSSNFGEDFELEARRAEAGIFY